MNKIYTFNTGRMYTQHGQRIAWTVQGIETDDVGDIHQVAFYDIDRCLSGVLTVHGKVNESTVLGAYDFGGYDWLEDYDLSEKLVKAAENSK